MMMGGCVVDIGVVWVMVGRCGGGVELGGRGEEGTVFAVTFRSDFGSHVCVSAAQTLIRGSFAVWAV